MSQLMIKNYNRETLLEELNKYKGIVPTGDKQDLKNERAKLNKLNKAVKELESEEIKIVKDKYKDIYEKVKEVKAPIEDLIFDIEEKEKKEKLDKIQEYINEKYKDIENKIIINSSYLNISMSMKKIKEDIDLQVKNIKAIEEKLSHIYQTDLRITGDIDKLNLLKEFLVNNNIKFKDFGMKEIEE